MIVTPYRIAQAQLPKIVEFSARFSDCILSFFQAAQGFFIVFGSEEKREISCNLCQRVSKVVRDHCVLSKLHGYLLIASGAFGAASFVSLTCSQTSLVLFLSAKLFALAYSSAILKFSYGNQVCFSLTRARRVNCLSLINSLGYICAIASEIFRGPLWATIACGSVAATAGGLRIMYEIIYKTDCNFV